MLKVLGVTKSNTNKNYFQQALEIYPQLLCDTYSKEILKQVKKSLVKEGKSGKLEVNGKYTFISPDMYAFCEYLFAGVKDISTEAWTTPDARAALLRTFINVLIATIGYGIFGMILG